MRQDCSGVENMPPVTMSVSARRNSTSNDSDASSPSGSPNGNELTGLPIKEGQVYALRNVNGRTVRVSVVLKVYSSSFGRYVVVAQNNIICRDCGFINLKNCSVTSSASDPDCVQQRISSCPPSATSPLTQPRPSSPSKNIHSFQLVPHNCEGMVLSFSVSSRTELEQWLSVLVSTSDDNSEASPRVIVGSPLRKALRELSPLRVASPKLGKRPLMPALEEE